MIFPHLCFSVFGLSASHFRADWLPKIGDGWPSGLKCGSLISATYSRARRARAFFPLGLCVHDMKVGQKEPVVDCATKLS